MNRKSFASLAAALCTLVFSVGVASAHVEVSPSTSTAGGWEQYTMRVPTEKNIPTEKVVLKVPQGATVESYQPVSGWTTSVQKQGDVTTSITWTATGGGIAPGQFQLFAFMAKNPASAGDMAWDAYQYYQDNTIVEWTGDKGSDTPHSITHIVAAAAGNTAPAGQTTANATGAATNDTQPVVNATSTPSPEPGTTASPTFMRLLALIVSAAALVVSIAALVVGMRKRS